MENVRAPAEVSPAKYSDKVAYKQYLQRDLAATSNQGLL